MKIININSEPKRVVVDVPLFTGGTVSTQFLVTRSMGQDYNALVVNFGKGARNKFHSHTCDQLLFVTAGKGILATEENQQPVGVGDFIFIPAGEKHWHGATKDSEFSHIAIATKTDEMTQLED